MTRKSKREIAEAIDEIDEEPPGDYPVVDTLAELFAHEGWEDVEDSETLKRSMDTGEIYYHPPEFQEAIMESLSNRD